MTIQPWFQITIKDKFLHTTTLRAVGRSVSVALPRHMLRSLGLEPGASVTISLDAGRLVVTPKRPRYRLADLLAGMKPGDMPTAEGWVTAPVGCEVR